MTVQTPDIVALKPPKVDTPTRLLRLVAESSGECTVRKLVNASGLKDTWVYRQMEVCTKRGWTMSAQCKYGNARHYTITSEGRHRLLVIDQIAQRVNPTPSGPGTRWAEAVHMLMCTMYSLDSRRNSASARVAAILGIRARTWRRWRSGENEPSMTAAAGLAAEHGFRFGFDVERGYWAEAVSEGGAA